MFLSLDGIDGAGKSTQLRWLEAWLREIGCEVVTCRDPGSTPLGERIRELLLHAERVSIGRHSEMLLYMAARAQLVEEVIRPALAVGKTVLSDRYLLANVVYQGHAGGLDVEELWRVGQVATGGLLPDLTIVLDMSAEAAHARLGSSLDRMERQGAEFRQRLRDGFLTEAARWGDRIAVVDASRSAEVVHAAVRQAVQRRWPEMLVREEGAS